MSGGQPSSVDHQPLRPAPEETSKVEEVPRVPVEVETLIPAKQEAAVAKEDKSRNEKRLERWKKFKQTLEQRKGENVKKREAEGDKKTTLVPYAAAKWNQKKKQNWKDNRRGKS